MGDVICYENKVGNQQNLTLKDVGCVFVLIAGSSLLAVLFWRTRQAVLRNTSTQLARDCLSAGFLDFCLPATTSFSDLANGHSEAQSAPDTRTNRYRKS